MSSTTELRQILKEDADGRNLYEHLTQTLMKILIEKPKNAYDSIESISASVKQSPLDPNPPVSKPLPLSAEQIHKQLHWTTQCGALLAVPEEPTDFYAPNDTVQSPLFFPDDVEALEWAGVSLGKGELYRLSLSIKKLAEGCPIGTKQLRLFGKISTRNNPYYVVQGLAVEGDVNNDEKIEEGRLGANKDTFWVSQNIEGADWIQLPNVTMAQIQVARKIKKLLTGDLEAAVTSYPPFDGVEKNLLRAQIARIVGSTSISPDGHFELSEDDVPVVKLAATEAVNEAFPKPASELKEPDAWKHHETGLNKLGRVQPMPEEIGEDGEPIVPEEEIEVFPPLNAIKPEHWTFRLAPGGNGSNASSVVVARSLRWPGAVAVAFNKKFLNVYTGNAVVNDNIKRPDPDNPNKMIYAPFAVPMPAPIETEWAPPAEDEEGALRLIEHVDAKVDPTPPKTEGEEEE